MIALRGATSRGPVGTLGPLDLELVAGVHALVGGASDGPSLLLAVLAGDAKVRAGEARVLGAAAGDSVARPRVAYVPVDVVLPEPARVDEALAMAAAVRGEEPGDAATRLDALGVPELAARQVSSLTPAERRTVALAEAVTSSARVLLLEEPLAGVDARATMHVASQLVRRARDGACVVIATASTRDARALSGHLLVFERGRLLGRTSAHDPVLFAGTSGAAVHVLTSSAAGLVAELASDDSLRASVEGDLVVVRGPDVVTIAAAVARAAAAIGAAVDALFPVLTDLLELRAAVPRDHPRPPSVAPPPLATR